MRYTDTTSFGKINFLFSVFLIFIIIIGSRLYFLQMYNHEHFALLGKKNFLRTQIIPCPRGNIVDCHGEILATNTPITHMYWQGSGNNQFSETQIEALKKINLILYPEFEESPLPFAKIKYAEKFGTKVKIHEDLSYVQLSQIAEQCMNCQNIRFDTHFKRHYPHGHTACHVLGYLGDVTLQPQGKMGIEKVFESVLQGNHGIVQTTINSFGRQLSAQQIKHAQKGGNLQTTLDLEMQKLAEQAFPEQDAGAMIILNPKTGDIKTLISRPGFDPTLFLKPISQEDWASIQSLSTPFLNRVFHALYPPASTFKLVTISAALEEHLINEHTKTYCMGYTTFAGRKYHCSRRTGHGLMDIQDSLAYSCNILFFDIAKRLHIDKLSEYAHKFGLGENTNVIFQDKTGVVPNNAWKIANKGERWWQGETLSAVIGQSFLLVTPIQVACMIGSIFEGYLVKPRITFQEEIETRPLKIQTSTRNFLKECMRMVITTGTGQRIKNLKDIQIFAKTGTAQVVGMKNPDGDDEEQEYARRHHAWFVSYFSYKHEDPLVLVLMIEHVGSSIYATTVAKNFLKAYVQSRKQAYAAKAADSYAA
ncbi:penicillin-binding protein 2 [bacterium]|nr:penicillin-binding protein 2 [bacterium]